MKKIKLLLPLIAVLIAVAGVFAMKANKTDQGKPVFAVQTWDYNGSSGDETDATQYSLGVAGSPTHTTCGDEKTTICQIKAEPDPSNPIRPDLNNQDPMDPQTDFDATFRADE